MVNGADWDRNRQQLEGRKQCWQWHSHKKMVCSKTTLASYLKSIWTSVLGYLGLLEYAWPAVSLGITFGVKSFGWQTLRERRLRIIEHISSLKKRQKPTLTQGFKVQAVYFRGDPRRLKEKRGRDRERKEFNKEKRLEHWDQLCTTVETVNESCCRTLEDRLRLCLEWSHPRWRELGVHTSTPVRYRLRATPRGCVN